MNATVVICIALLGIFLLVVVYALGFFFGADYGWDSATVCIFEALNCLKDDDDDEEEMKGRGDEAK